MRNGQTAQWLEVKQQAGEGGSLPIIRRYVRFSGPAPPSPLVPLTPIPGEAPRTGWDPCPALPHRHLLVLILQLIQLPINPAQHQ
jgi:hypothetical protein